MKRTMLVSIIFTLFFTGCSSEPVEDEYKPSPYETFTITEMVSTPSINGNQKIQESKENIAFVNLFDFDSYYHIYIIDSNDGLPIRLTSTLNNADEGAPTWSPDGSMIAFHYGEYGSRDIYVVDVNQDKLTRVTQHPDSWGSEWAPDSRRIAFVSDRDGSWQLFLIDVDGKNEINIVEEMGSIGELAWSPDGNWIAFSSAIDGNRDIYIVKEDGSYLERLTKGPENNSEPVWSPNGNQIAFVSGRTGNADIFLLDIKSRVQTQLTYGLEPDFFPVWSPDGSKIAFESGIVFRSRDIYVVDVDGTNLTQLTNNPCDDAGPTWSPDGTQIAFSALLDTNKDIFTPDCTGNYEIFIVDVDGSNLIRLTDNLGEDKFPDWQPSK